ncbi:MAG: phage holin family protein [Candidatus Shapirobacteria bacterium]|jgi:putative membrane protein
MIKRLAKYTLLSVFALITVNQIWGNFSFLPVLVLLKSALVLSLFEVILKPIVKLLLLPINILTLGLFRIIINTLGLYLAIYFVPEFKVGNIATSGFSWQGFVIPAFSFQAFFAILVSSFTFSIIFYLFKLICTKK